MTSRSIIPVLLAAFFAGALTAVPAKALETYASAVVDQHGARTLNNFMDGGAGALGTPDVSNEPVLDQKQRNCSGWRESTGYMVLGFDGILLQDGAGDDLTVYHIRYGRTDGGNPPPGVYVSADEQFSAGGMTWTLLGRLSPPSSQGESRIVRADSFDFGESGADNIYFVKIEKTASGKYTGKYIDAVKAHYSTATETTNTEPFPPVLLSPGNFAPAGSLVPVLTAGPFDDPDPGDTHLATQWQITSTSSFYEDDMIYDVTSTVFIKSLTVPDMLLNPRDFFNFWRVRFYDQGHGESRWSETFGFSMFGLAVENDANGNGIPDDQEVDYGIGSEEIRDMDANGVMDDAEPDRIKCVKTGDGTGQIGVGVTAGGPAIEFVRWNALDTLIGEALRPDEMPLGLVGFKLVVDNPGETVEIVIHCSEALPENVKWYQHDAVKQAWTVYSETLARFDEDRVRVGLQWSDGGSGDLDGVANGVILGRGGPGIQNALPPDALTITIQGAGADTVDASGCFVGALMEWEK